MAKIVSLKSRVDKLDQIGDSAHDDDELVPTSSFFVRIAAKIIDSDSLIGRLLRRYWVTVGDEPCKQIQRYKTWKKEWDESELQRKENAEENRSYIASLKKQRSRT